MDLNILGIDPGFGNIGICVSKKLYKENLNVIRMDTITTKPEYKKRNNYVEDDNMRRIRIIVQEINNIIETNDINVICFEEFSQMRNAVSARKVYGVIGGILTLAFIHDIPIFQSRPQDIKLKLCKKRSATKIDIQNALNEMFPEIKNILPKATGKHEHCYDALSSIVSCLDSDILKIISINI